jgi:hypothetical protein
MSSSSDRGTTASVLDLIGAAESWSPKASGRLRTPRELFVFSDLICPESQAAKNGHLIRHPIGKCHIIIYEVFNNHSTIMAGSRVKSAFEFGHRQEKTQNKFSLHPLLGGGWEQGAGRIQAVPTPALGQHPPQCPAARSCP